MLPKFDVLTGCTFCEIIANREPAVILEQNNDVLVIEDIYPASNNHFLVIPKRHIKNAMVLTKDHLKLLEEMETIGLSVLQKIGGIVEDTLIGFHWPPFNSVGHLHLHFIYPASQIKSHAIEKFNRHIWWFVSYELMVDIIKNSEKYRKTKYKLRKEWCDEL